MSNRESCFVDRYSDQYGGCYPHTLHILGCSQGPRLQLPEAFSDGFPIGADGFCFDPGLILFITSVFLLFLSPSLNGDLCQQIFIPFGKLGSTIFGLLMTIVFSGFIIYDTNNLIKRFKYNEYILASISLYLDIMNLFLGMLGISGGQQCLLIYSPTYLPPTYLVNIPPIKRVNTLVLLG